MLCFEKWIIPPRFPKGLARLSCKQFDEDLTQRERSIFLDLLGVPPCDVYFKILEECQDRSFLEGGGEKKTFHSHHLGEAQGRPTTSTKNATCSKTKKNPCKTPRQQDQNLNNDEETFKPREDPLAIYNKVIT